MGGMHQLASSKPKSSWQNPTPTPKPSSSGLQLINLSSFSYVFLEVFVFPESISDGWVAFWGVSRKTPKMLAPTPEAPSSLPSNSLHAAPGGLLLKRGVGEACKLEWVPQDGISF